MKRSGAIRLRQRRTLRQVSASARVSLGYLSEIERGQKEPSSELLAAICSALDVRLSDLFAEVSDTMRRDEKRADVARHAAGLVGASAPGTVVPVVPVGPRLTSAAPRRLTNPTAVGGRLAPPSGPVQPGPGKRAALRASVPPPDTPSTHWDCHRSPCSASVVTVVSAVTRCNDSVTPRHHQNSCGTFIGSASVRARAGRGEREAGRERDHG